MLAECSVPLWERYDLAILDLDGVVYVGPEAVAGAPEHLRAAHDAGIHLAYVTNNAARTPAEVADHLLELGLPAAHEDVVTSAQAAARLVAQYVPAGSAVYVIGGRGLFEALAEHDLKGVQTLAEDPKAVVSGYHPNLLWRTVVTGAILVRRGVPWVASNTDMTLPTTEGPGPGNGVLVGAVARFAEREPTVAGKPQPPLFTETRLRVGGDRPLVVGDRLDTDIEGAANAGLDSLLVMTGVTGVAELVAADPRQRPTYLAAELSGLGSAHPVPAECGDGSQALHGWTAHVEDDALQVHGEGTVDDWWRVVAAAGWKFRDAAGRAADTTHLTPPGSVGRETDQGKPEDGET